jgi:hypothetical protein
MSNSLKTVKFGWIIFGVSEHMDEINDAGF